MSSRLERLKKERRNITSEINVIEEGNEAAENKKLIGKFFTYRNCYSCPQSEEDYWNIYIRITGYEHDSLLATKFQDNGKARIEIEHHTSFRLNSSYTEIKKEEYFTAWNDLMNRLSFLQDD